MKSEYGVVGQEACIAALDSWDELAQARNVPRTDFLLMYRMVLEEAEAVGGMTSNDVGRSYYLLRKMGIVGKEREDILLKVNGDLSRFEEIYTLIQRISRGKENQAAASTVPRMVSQFYVGDDEDGW